MLKRVAFIVVVLLLVGVGAFLPEYIERQIPPRRSVAFQVQLKITYDAIERYHQAGGFTRSLAKLEADREWDALCRLSHTPFEGNTLTVLQSYRFAGEILAAMGNPEQGSTREDYDRKASEVLTVLF